jgi:hypothetical protein
MPLLNSFAPVIHGACSFLQEMLKALLQMRRNSNEKEQEALLSGEQDSCPCYIEVHLYMLVLLPF